MSPRGVADPGIRDALLRAAERVLAEQGVGALTVRAIAAEAGCATGVLYNHFADRDDLLAAVLVDRFHKIADDGETLVGVAGKRTVKENLLRHWLATLGGPTVALQELVHSSPGLVARVLEVFGPHDPVRTYLQAPVARYLRAEQQLGRVRADADAEAAALLLVGAVHHLALTGQPVSRRAVNDLLVTLWAGLSPAGPA